jgi:iron complex outermembrane receptor protein
MSCASPSGLRGLAPLARFASVFALLFGGLNLAGVATAQTMAGSGAVAGVVVDGETGRFLEGAEVSIAGTTIRGTTARDGSFVLRNVPVGLRELVVSYPALDSQNIPVEVAAGSIAQVDNIRLSSGVVVLGEFRVQTAREGMSQAMALQKASTQSKLVAASDQFGDIAEGNVGEYLKFLPGVGIDYTANDARSISLRGLNPNFTTVAVDGSPMASAASSEDSRRFEFEQVAINNVETIEVFKTVTPDMPADSTGGQVNLVTKSAFDREGSHFSYNVFLTANSENVTLSKRGAWGQGEKRLVRPNADFNYSTRLSENVGVNVNYRFSEIYHDAPRSEFAWDFRPASGASADNPYLRTYQLRDEQKLTHRESFATKFDFRLSERTTFSLSGQWNWYDLVFTQRGPVFDTGTAPASRDGQNAVTSRPAVGTITNGVLQRNKYGTTWNFVSQLEHRFERSRLWGNAYFSQADNFYRDTNKGFHSEFNPNITQNQIAISGILSAPRPEIVATKTGQPADYFRQLSSYTYTPSPTGGNFRSRPFTSKDTKEGLSLNYRHSLDLAVPVAVQVGAAFDRAERYSRRTDIRVAPGAMPTLTGAALAQFVNEVYTGDVGFGWGPLQTVDVYKLYEAYPNALGTLNSDLVRNIDEDNTSLYLRADVELSPALLLVGGVRWERREISASGINNANPRARLATGTLDYNEFYPSLNLKYTPTRDWVFRAGLGRTVGHPNFSDIIPEVIDPNPATGTGGSLSIPNPNIKPYFVTNYDVSAEYYFGSTGVFSLSLFRKETSNFITRIPSAIPLANFPADQLAAIVAEYGLDPTEIGGYSVRTAENSGGTHVQGVELSFSQAFTFLPKPLNGFSLQTNLTKISVGGDTPDLDIAQREKATLDAFNFVLSYRWGKFSAISTNSYTGDIFWEFNTTNATNLLRYKAAEWKSDLRLEWAFSRRFAVYLQVRNLFGEPREDFIRPLDRTYRDAIKLPYRYTEFGDPIYALGVRGSF